jgi:glycosyltransferase involved in cell wall biosynthesis
MEDYKISVLLAAYNCEKYIAEAIQSLLNQSYTNIEILIADDCSADNTRKIIDSFTDHRLFTFHNDKNQKKPATINKLFTYSTGNLITIHDGDDISLPQRFEKTVAMFKKYPEIAMCGHFIQRMTEKGKLLNLYREKIDNFELIKENMYTMNTDGDASMVFKKNIIPNIGNQVLRPYFTNSMDYDLGLRIIEKYKSTNILEVLYFYRNVPNSISKGILNSKKLIMPKMANFFHKERLEKGDDALTRGDIKYLEAKEKEFWNPYLNDKTLHLREMAGAFMYYKMYNTAIIYAWKSVKNEPYKFINWRTLQHCLRKSFIGI